MKKIICLLILLPLFGVSQNRVILNNNGYITIDNGAFLVIENSNPNAITTLGSGGNILSEGEDDVIQWEIGATTGNYVIPWTTASSVKIPLAINKTTTGTGATAEFILSTWETATDMNSPWPTAVSNMNWPTVVDGSLDVVDRFWHIDALSYAAKPDITLIMNYDPAPNEIGGTNTLTEANLLAQRFNTTLNHWETYKLFGTNDAVNDRVSGIAVPAADFFEDWILVDNLNPLPITLIDFKVDCSDQLIEISWSTATEINNDYFVVEKSHDATTFFELETIQGAGNSNVILNYEIIDDNNQNASVYYRLKQVDFNGTTTYFDIKTANCIKDDNDVFTGYFSHNELVIDYLSDHPKNIEIVLFDIKGKLVFKHTIMPFNGKNKVALNLPLAKGMYVLNLMHNNTHNNIKLIK